MKFKKGDKVRCIDLTDAIYLTLGKVYEVMGTAEAGKDYKYVAVINDNGYIADYWETRFELVEEPDFKPGDKVRCIDLGDTIIYLTLHKVYEVTKVDGNGGVTVINDIDRVGYYSKTSFELVSFDDDQSPSAYIAENLDFVEAVRQLGMGHRLGMAGTDWSWYYRWGIHNGDFVLVDECGKPAHLSFQDYMSKEWIISW